MIHSITTRCAFQREQHILVQTRTSGYWSLTCLIMSTSVLTRLDEGLIIGLATAVAIILILSTLLLLYKLKARRKTRRQTYHEEHWTSTRRYPAAGLGVRSSITPSASFLSPGTRIDSGAWSAEDLFVPHNIADVAEDGFLFRAQGDVDHTGITTVRVRSQRSRSATVAVPHEISKTIVNDSGPRTRSYTLGAIGPAPTCPLPPLPFQSPAEHAIARGDESKTVAPYTSKAAQIVLQVLEADDGPQHPISPAASSQRSSGICPLDTGSPNLCNRAKGHRRKGYVHIPHLRLEDIGRFAPQSYLHPNDSKLSLSSISLDNASSNDLGGLIDIPSLPYLDDLFDPPSEVTTPTFRLTRPSGEMERRTSFPFLSETPSPSIVDGSDEYPWPTVVDHEYNESSRCSSPCSGIDMTTCSDPLDMGLDVSPRTRSFPRKADIVAAYKRKALAARSLPAPASSISPEPRCHSPLGAHPPARPLPSSVEGFRLEFPSSKQSLIPESPTLGDGSSTWSSSRNQTPDSSSPAPRRVLGELQMNSLADARPPTFRCHTGLQSSISEGLGMRLPSLHVGSYDARALRENVFAINAGFFDGAVSSANLQTRCLTTSEHIEWPKTAGGAFHEWAVEMGDTSPCTPRRTTNFDIVCDARSPPPSEEVFFTPCSLYDAEGFLR